MLRDFYKCFNKNAFYGLYMLIHGTIYVPWIRTKTGAMRIEASLIYLYLWVYARIWKYEKVLFGIVKNKAYTKYYIVVIFLFEESIYRIHEINLMRAYTSFQVVAKFNFFVKALLGSQCWWITKRASCHSFEATLRMPYRENL